MSSYSSKGKSKAPTQRSPEWSEWKWDPTGYRYYRAQLQPNGKLLLLHELQEFKSGSFLIVILLQVNTCMNTKLLPLPQYPAARQPRVPRPTSPLPAPVPPRGASTTKIKTMDIPKEVPQ